MKRPEILAPVGSKESLVAAVMAGADAVYLGGYMFGARSFSLNFNNEEMVEAINYAHLYGVKVYVTLNTLIFDNEVEMFLAYVEFLHKNNVDAVIMQDLGMVDLVHKTYPNLEIHASTQMHIHNLEGVLTAEKLGIKRCVLARELEIEEIKNLKKKSLMPLEIFVHGALCISYSGQCLFSSMIGGRSGNRGTCAQSCRQNYSFYSDDKKIDEGYLLSAKDLNTINEIGNLIDLGIDSIKIEGRMKRPEYVYLITSLYKKAVDNYLKFKDTKITSEDIFEIKKIFNREFTKGFLFHEKNEKITNKERPNHMGVKIGDVTQYRNNSLFIKLSSSLSINDGIRILSKEDIGFTVNSMFINDKKILKANSGDVVKLKVKGDFKVGDAVLKTTDYNQINEINDLINSNLRKVMINGILTAKLGNELELELDDGSNKVSVKSDYIVCSALSKPTTEDIILTQVSKLGDTVYEFMELSFDISENIFIPLIKLNELRREATTLLNEKRLYKTDYLKAEYSIKLDDYEVKHSINSYNKEGNFNKIYSDIKTENMILKTPRVVKSYIDNEYCLISEVGGIYNRKEFDTDFSFNVTNIYTVALLHSLGAKQVMLSYELNDNQIEDLVKNYHLKFNKHPNLEVLVYGREELMINKFDLNKYYNLFNDTYLVDRFNNKYPIVSYDDYMIIYNYKIRDKKNIDYFKMGINNIRHSYTKYDK